MSDRNQDKEHHSDDDKDGHPQDVRSRIAAFEQTGIGGASARGSAKPKTTSTSGLTSSRTAVLHGSYDPLQAPSKPTKSDESVVVKPSERFRVPSASSSETGPGTRVALPGLGGRNAASTSIVSASPTSVDASARYTFSHSRPQAPVKRPSFPSEVSSAIRLAMDDNASIRNTDGTTMPANAVPSAALASSQAGEPSSASLPPPDLPVRKNSNASTTSASTPFSSFTNVSPMTGEPSDLISRVPPPLPPGKSAPTPGPSSTAHPTTAPNVPKLPPRKQERGSSATLADATSVSFPRPPLRTSTLADPPTSNILPQGTDSRDPSDHLLLSSTSQSDATNKSSAPSLTSLPPRPRNQSAPYRPMPPPTSRSLPASGSLTPIPASRLPTANGSHASPSPPDSIKRYELLWDTLAKSLGQQHRIAEFTRLDGIVIREVWKLSKLNDAALGRIWGQCDVSQQGALDKAGFCKGLALIDSELRRQRRSRRA